MDRAVRIADSIVEAGDEARIWSVRSQTDGAFLGLISLDDHVDGKDTEVSFQFLPEAQGQGLASEALTLALAKADGLGLSRLIAETQTQNLASCRLLERHGFVRERELVRFDALQAVYAVVI